MGRTLHRSALVFVLSVCLSATAAAEEPQAAKPDTQGPDTPSSKTRGFELFEQQIQPVLIEQCYECHSKNGKDIEGGLELDSPSGMARGGDSGPMLIAHEAKKSMLLRMLRHEDDVSGMPPEHQLPEEVVLAFEEWIRLGAPDTRQEIGPTAKEQRLEVSRGHWAFQPPQAVEPPVVGQADWPRDAVIDTFLLAGMEAAGVHPVGDANRRTLVRRVYFDLIGLLPSPAEVEAFVADETPEALANLIDRLLASPRFGERWGRHWLDVVRYAESSGMEFNFTYPHAWPYRNYVIDSLNADKPFDVFLREQIAGDLLPDTEGESPEAREARQIAPSMLAFGPKRHNSGGVEYQMDVVDDQINTVCRATVALTVSCARCHDHKFDPIPTTDYYALAGIFLSTEPLYGTIQQKYSNNPTDLLPIGPDALAMHTAAEDHAKQITDIETPLTASREELKKATEAEEQATAAKVEAESQLAAATALLESENTADAENTAEAEVATDEAATESTDPAAGETSEENETEAEAAPAATAEPTAEAGVTPEPTVQQKLDNAITVLAEATAGVTTLKEAIAASEARVEELKKNRPARPAYAMTARDRAEPADTTVAIRGDFRERGDVVPRGFLGAVSVENPPPIEAGHSGRLELADWITRRDNPLTARVMVNRIWHHLFGRGLVATVDNFGIIGKAPSHPELLDALALRFVSEGWSVKNTVREVMLSRAYQLSSVRDAANSEIDPANILLWRATPRRLEAEALRDAVLAVSGQLNLERPQGSTVTPLGDQLVRGIATEKLQPPSTYRSVYLPVVRDYVPELFDLFDFPSPSLVSGQRSVTNVPSQALYLRNSAFVAEQARHAAERLLASEEVTDDAGRVDLATRWTLGRGVSDAERTGALHLIEQVRQTEVEGTDSNVSAYSAWFLTLYTTAEFRYLVDVN